MNENSDFNLSFKPLIFQNTEILILGSLPGKKSIELNQYYGHSRNRIWSILSYLKEKETPTNYDDKKVFLNSLKIGLWDVAKSAIRKGSLDSNIKDERPNNIDLLTKTNPSIKVIGFNGKKSEQMFYKFFKLNPDIKYVSLPSSSPANMAINFENICKKWSQLFL
jgi:hypoxanthine-DNA glycosylase